MSRTDLYQLIPTTTEQYETPEFSQRVNAAIKSATNVGPTLLIAERTDDGMRDYLALPASPQSRTAAENFAEAVSAEAVLIDPDDETHRELSETLTGSHIARAEFPQATSGRYTPANTEPLAVSRIVPTILEPGHWFAIAARQPGRREFRNWATWFRAITEGEVSTHPSLETNSVIIEVYSGATDSASEAKHNLSEVLAAMPGFDTIPKPRNLPDARGIAAPITALLIFLAAFFILPERIGGPASQIVWWLTLILTATAAAVTVLRAVGVSKTPGRKLRGNLAQFRIPVSKRWMPVRTPRREVIEPMTGRVKKRAFTGDYPLTKHSTKTAPAVFASVFSPSAGVVSGETHTARRDVDTRFSKQIGPLIAEAAGIPIHLQAAAASFGTSFLGAAGSGKSQTLRSIFGFSCLERIHPSGLPGFPGKSNTLIAIENKGPDGAAEYLAWSEAMGDTVTLIDLADDTTACLDLFGKSGGSLESQAGYFVSLMKSGFAEGEIGPRATNSLTRCIAAGLAVDDDIVDEANESISEAGAPFPLGASPLTYAHILLGGWTGGDDDAIRLYGALKAAAGDYEDGDEDIDDESGARYVEAVKQLAYLFHSKTPAQRAGLIESSENKIAQLRQLEGFFSPDRTSVDLYAAIENHDALVINLGPSISGTQVAEHLTKIFSAMVTHAVRDAVAATCSGWQAKNRWVSLFGDELALLAGSSPEVVTWFREQGRAFGVRTFFATQRPNQVPEEVRESFLGADTLFAYRQSAANVVEAVLAEVSLDGEKWSAQDITKLPNFTAIIRTTIDGTRQNSFVATMVNFEANRSDFARMQGYDLAAIPASKDTPVPVTDYDQVVNDYDIDGQLED